VKLMLRELLAMLKLRRPREWPKLKLLHKRWNSVLTTRLLLLPLNTRPKDLLPKRLGLKPLNLNKKVNMLVLIRREWLSRKPLRTLDFLLRKLQDLMLKPEWQTSSLPTPTELRPKLLLPKSTQRLSLKRPCLQKRKKFKKMRKPTNKKPKLKLAVSLKLLNKLKLYALLRPKPLPKPPLKQKLPELKYGKKNALLNTKQKKRESKRSSNTCKLLNRIVWLLRKPLKPHVLNKSNLSASTT